MGWSSVRQEDDVMSDAVAEWWWVGLHAPERVGSHGEHTSSRVRLPELALFWEGLAFLQ